MTPTLTIGDVARQASINASAIRYYERQGVLPEPDRLNGKRRYEPEVLQRLEIIEAAKKAGLTLDDVRTLFETTDAGAPAHAELRALAQARLPQVEALIQHATEMKRWLEASSQCSCDSLDDCSLFDPTASSSGDDCSRCD